MKDLERQLWRKIAFAKRLASAFLSCGLFLAPVVSEAATWQRILTCDNGRAWLDVDSTERRRVQVVVRNPEAIRYLNSLGVNYASRTDETMELTFNLNHEVGVFTPADFILGTASSQFENKLAKKIGDEYFVKYSEQIYAFRDGTGLKIEFVRTGLDICNYYDARNQSCVDGRTHYVRDRYIGNWYFPDCKNQLSAPVRRGN